jgi:endoglucanase
MGIHVAGARTVAAAVAALVVGASLIAGAAPASAVSGAPQPVVDGADLVDGRTGETWVPHGANWPNFEYSCVQGWRPDYSQAEADAMASWGIDLVRLPLNQDCWLGVDGAPTSGAGTKSQYRAAIAEWVGMIEQAGMAVILDLHWTAPAGRRADGQRAMADAQSADFWTSIAADYADDASVMFELFNEPYSFWNPDGDGYAYDLTWACWRDGGAGCRAPVEADTAESLSGATYAVVGMATLVDRVRAAGADQPILLGGRNYANDLAKWLEYRPDDDQLVAAWHNYAGQGCSTSCWNSTITTVQQQVPVLMTEFGDTAKDSPAYLNRVMDWADDHDMGYLPWAWWDVEPAESATNARYSLFDEENGEFVPRAPSGTAYRGHLAGLGLGDGDPDPEPEPDRLSRSQSHVTALYVDFLERTPRAGERDYWADAIDDGLSSDVLSGSFLSSQEYLRNEVTRLYQDYLGRTPSASERDGWVGRITSGATNVDTIQVNFFASPEYYRRAGGTDVGFVAALFRDALGRAGEPRDHAAWAAVVPRSGRAAVANAIWTSAESRTRRVDVYYELLIGRPGDAAGLAYWSGLLTTRSSTAIQVAMSATREYVDRAVRRFPR